VTSPACVDPAVEIIAAFKNGMRQGFDPESPCPPDGGGITTVRFFAGQGALPNWDPDTDGCAGPFLWVRAAHRYRSLRQDFPAAYARDVDDCREKPIRVLAVEVGVARCTNMDAQPDWDTLDDEAIISLDDSWRIEQVLCAVTSRLKSKERAVATDTVEPHGPEGGIIAWTGMAYVQI
jgi:hypothetical protein